MPLAESHLVWPIASGWPDLFSKIGSVDIIGSADKTGSLNSVNISFDSCPADISAGNTKNAFW